MKKIIAILLALALLVLLVPVSCAPAGREKPIDLYISGSSAASGSHMYVIAIANLWNEKIPEVNFTPVEAKGAAEGTTSVEDGRFQVSGTWSADSGPIKEMYKIEPMQDRPVVNGWRQIFMREPGTVMPFFVRADSDIKTLSDLDGRKFCPGIRGSSQEPIIKNAMAALGIKPDYFAGSTAEAVAAMKEKRIEAYMKAGSGYQIDAAVIEITVTVPLRYLSWTEEEAEKVMKSGLCPGQGFVKIPAGAIKTFPELGPVLSFTSACGNGPGTMKGVISQELGYKMAKVLFENWEYLQVIWPGCKLLEEMFGSPIQGTIEVSRMSNEVCYDKFQEFHPGYSPVPLHPGTVQYFKEMGYDVPELIIPPEYKG